MNKWNQFTKNHRLTYQIAAVLVIVAALGLTFMYFYERSVLKQQQAKEAVEEESESVSKVVEPTVPKVDSYDTVEESPEITENVTEDAAANQNVISQDVMDEVAETSTVTLHFPGELAWPLEGKVLLDYSMDHTIFFPTLQQYRYNPAIIIGGEVNAPVLSACDGKVESVLTNAKTGTTLTLDIGDGYQAVYGQLKEIPVATGSYVSKGQCIGYLGEPSKYYTEEGANLYFQILKDGEAVNPQEFLEQ